VRVSQRNTRTGQVLCRMRRQGVGENPVSHLRRGGTQGLRESREAHEMRTTCGKTDAHAALDPSGSPVSARTTGSEARQNVRSDPTATIEVRADAEPEEGRINGKKVRIRMSRSRSRSAELSRMMVRGKLGCLSEPTNPVQ